MSTLVLSCSSPRRLLSLLRSLVSHPPDSQGGLAINIPHTVIFLLPSSCVAPSSSFQIQIKALATTRVLVEPSSVSSIRLQTKSRLFIPNPNQQCCLTRSIGAATPLVGRAATVTEVHHRVKTQHRTSTWGFSCMMLLPMMPHFVAHTDRRPAIGNVTSDHHLHSCESIAPPLFFQFFECQCELKMEVMCFGIIKLEGEGNGVKENEKEKVVSGEFFIV